MHLPGVTVFAGPNGAGKTSLLEAAFLLSHGRSFRSGAREAAVEHNRGPKVISFKKRRRQNSKRSRGHRQHHTVVRIVDIVAAK